MCHCISNVRLRDLCHHRGYRCDCGLRLGCRGGRLTSQRNAALDVDVVSALRCAKEALLQRIPRAVLSRQDDLFALAHRVEDLDEVSLDRRE